MNRGLLGLRGKPSAVNAGSRRRPLSPLLDYCSYRGPSDASYTKADGTYTAIDSINLVVTFIVPASGKVKLERSSCCYMDTSYYTLYWGILSNGLNVVGSFVRANQPVPSPCSLSVTTLCTIEGLTPGTLCVWQWSHAVDGGTGYTQHGPNIGASSMFVYEIIDK